MFIETPDKADNGQEQASGGTLGDIVELAQTGPGGAEPIGKVSSVQGGVTITHPDGAKVQAAGGTPIFQGDTVETGKDGAVGITFADNSTFALADSGAMTIDEMVYDPAN